jgi:hypothetical protein
MRCHVRQVCFGFTLVPAEQIDLEPHHPQPMNGKHNAPVVRTTNTPVSNERSAHRNWDKYHRMAKPRFNKLVSKAGPDRTTIARSTRQRIDRTIAFHIEDIEHKYAASSLVVSFATICGV